MFGGVFGKLFGGKGAETEVAQPVGPLSGLSILLVNADTSARARDAGLLRVSGATVYEASDAASALGGIKARTIDAVVVEGDDEGIGLLRTLRDSPITQHLAVVVVAPDWTDAKMVFAAKQSGASGLATRPWDAATLSDKIIAARARAAG